VADEGFIGTASGGLVGLLIGILGGPLGVLLGGTTGIAVGSLFDLDDADETDSVLSDVSKTVQPGRTSVLAQSRRGASYEHQGTEPESGGRRRDRRTARELQIAQLAAPVVAFTRSRVAAGAGHRDSLLALGVAALGVTSLLCAIAPSIETLIRLPGRTGRRGRDADSELAGRDHRHLPAEGRGPTIGAWAAWGTIALRLPVGSGAGRLVELTRPGDASRARRECGPDAHPPGDEHGRTQGDQGAFYEQGGNP